MRAGGRRRRRRGLTRAWRRIAESRGWRVLSDTALLSSLVDRLVRDNADKVAAIHGGNQRVLGWFVGQVMKETQGQASPELVNQLLRERVTAPRRPS